MYLVLLVSENIAVSDQMPGEADPQQVEETNIKLQVNANSQGNTTQCEPLNDSSNNNNNNNNNPFI